MVSRRLLLGATVLCLLVGALGVYLFAQERAARCASVPLLTAELLPNANLLPDGDVPGMPAGWSRAAGGVQLRGPAVDGEGFDVDGDGRALQLIGIANYAQTPPVPVQPGRPYCFSGLTLSDSALGSTTRARLVFAWADASGQPLGSQATVWQPVRLWTPENPPRDWSPILGSFTAPDSAASLMVRVEPASDDRIYLDAMHVRNGGAGLSTPVDNDVPVPIEIAPWPLGRRAAVSFSFDWETAMGGLVHSRSLDDPAFNPDFVLRGMRMREGITTTLALFRPYGVRATYFATGYNFLRGNQERRAFLDNPTFSWASKANGWTTDRWKTTPWFADDPYGTYRSDPAWYFGDLIDPLLADGHEIQSHTFSHLYGGLASIADWQADLNAWNAVAAEDEVAQARTLAFPWSGSAGMSDVSWDALEQAGIVAVTRLSDQAQYNLFPADDRGLIEEPRCRWLPGRESRLLACPDFYLTVDSAPLALEQLNRTIEAGGMIDLWAHTEEVVTPEQIAAWGQVVRRAAEDAQVWVAPFSEIAGWQIASSQLRIEQADAPAADGSIRYSVSNPSKQDLVGLGLRMPAGTTRVALAGDDLSIGSGAPSHTGWWPDSGLAVIDLGAGQTVEITVWPAP